MYREPVLAFPRPGGLEMVLHPREFTDSDAFSETVTRLLGELRLLVDVVAEVWRSTSLPNAAQDEASFRRSCYAVAVTVYDPAPPHLLLECVANLLGPHLRGQVQWGDLPGGTRG